MKPKFEGTATFESAKDKSDAKEYSKMREAKTAYLEERSKQLNS